MKKALLLCTSHNDLGLIKALRKLGYYIVATGNKEDSPGQKWVDKYRKADYSDQELILSIAREEQIDVICQCCNDYGVYTAAHVAEQMGLPGYDSYETTLILHNKDKFKKFAEENNILTPTSVSFESRDIAYKTAEEMQFPLIVKPVDASAGNGITKISSLEEVEEAIDKAFDKSRRQRIVIESYIEGTQHGFCTFLINQKVVAYCTNNEYSIVNPYRVEIDTFPADSWSDVHPVLVEQIERIARLLNLKDGIFHLQYILRDGKPWIIEVMRRILGNMYSIPAGMLTGIEWDYWEARARCGLSCEDFPKKVNQEGFFAYKTILAEKNGYIQNICIPEKYDKFKIEQFMLKEPGDYIENYKSEPIGFLFFMFSSMEQMRQILIEEYDNSIIEIQEI